MCLCLTHLRLLTDAACLSSPCSATWFTFLSSLLVWPQTSLKLFSVIWVWTNTTVSWLILNKRPCCFRTMSQTVVHCCYWHNFLTHFVKLKALNVDASMFLRDSLFIVVSENSSAAFSPQEWMSQNVLLVSLKPMPKGLVKSLVRLKWCKCIRDAVSMLRIPQLTTYSSGSLV